MRIRNDEVKGIPDYDIDLEGTQAPQVWYGTAAINGSVSPWSTAPVGSQYLRRDLGIWFQKVLGGAWEQIGSGTGLGDRVFVVGSGGDYASLSAALAAITDASDSKEYLIVVADEITETATVSAKSHVHILFMPNSSLTVTGGTHALSLSSVTNIAIVALNPARQTIIRSSSGSGSCHAIAVSGSNNIYLVGVYAQNSVTGAASGYGLDMASSSTVRAIECRFVGASAINGHGISLFTGTLTAERCWATGAGTSGHGIIAVSGTLTARDCVFTGGGSSDGYGAFIQSMTATLTNCEAIGGSSSTTGHGMYTLHSTVQVVGGEYRGGGATGYGIYAIYGSVMARAALFTSQATTAARGGYVTLAGTLSAQRCLFATASISNAVGLYVDANGLALLSHCTLMGGGLIPIRTNTTIGVSTRQEDALGPSTTQPWRILAAYLNVITAAAAGVTLTLRTASGGGGNAISGAIAVDSTGDKQVPITGHYVINAGSSIYARLSASDSTLSYTFYYVYEHAPTGAYALYDDSQNACIFSNCTLLSGSQSDAIYVTTNGDDQSRFMGGMARSGLNGGTRPKAIVCQASWSPGQVYNMTLEGGSTNLTAATGTANGSNIEA